MFARLQPRIVARTFVPILLAVPLNASAATAMVSAAIAACCGLLVLLVLSVVSVSGEAARWLLPLPVTMKRMARALWFPALMAFGSASVLTAWLLWVNGTGVQVSLKIGAVTFVAGSLSAGLAAVLTIARAARFK
jgi:hypothetical protein